MCDFDTGEPPAPGKYNTTSQNIKKSLSRSYPAKLALMHVGVLFIFRAHQNRLVTLRTLRTYLIRN
jgi:hypothetical protein